MRATMNDSPAITDLCLMSISGQRTPRGRARRVLTAWRRLLRASCAPPYTQADAQQSAGMKPDVKIFSFPLPHAARHRDAAQLSPPPQALDVCDNRAGGGEIRATAGHTGAMHPDFDLPHPVEDMPRTGSVRD